MEPLIHGGAYFRNFTVYWKRKAFLLYANESEVHVLERLAFYESVKCLLSALTSVYITFKWPNQGFRRVTYVPSLIFKPSSCFVSFVTISVQMSQFEGHVACLNLP